jgi:beta-lactamase class D
MSPGRKRAVLAGGAVVMIAIVVAAVVLLKGGPSSDAAPAGSPASTATDAPDIVIAKYLDAFGSGDGTAVGGWTDDPTAASAAYLDSWRGLGTQNVNATLTQLMPVAAGAAKTSATFKLGWTLASGKTFTYDDSLDLVHTSGHWLVHWSPAILHPKLGAGQHLVATATTVTAGPTVVDRDGKPLVGGGAPNAFPLLSTALSGGQAKATGAAPTAGYAITSADATGKTVATLYTEGQVDDGGKPRTSTLSLADQQSAQAAVDSLSGSAVLIAIQPSTGGILAIAQNAAAGAQPKALSGLYAPGSTFKIVTATAALEQGDVTAESPLPCPLSAVIGQRTIKNEGFQYPAIPMRTAFAHSCNTTFAQLASALPADGLSKAADQLGLNADFTIPGVSTEAGRVDAAGSPAEQVEDGIGQGKVQASPFGMALVASTVASGRAVTPQLWADDPTQVGTGYHAPSASVLASVRKMMREVVTGGTAKAGLAGTGGTVYGKTGTAQFGDGEEANGWFVGYRGDVAFAVLLEGSNDSKPAVKMAGKFLGGL